MMVTINDKWRVSIDDLNHTLERYDEGGKVISVGKYSGQLSKPSWTIHGFYPNMLQCLRAVVRAEAILLPDTDLNGYIERLERLNDEIRV
jgi:hypothetical protein